MNSPMNTAAWDKDDESLLKMVNNITYYWRCINGGDSGGRESETHWMRTLKENGIRNLSGR